MRKTRTVALASVLLLTASSVTFAQGAATPSGQGADISISQTHNGAGVSISGQPVPLEPLVAAQSRQGMPTWIPVARGRIRVASNDSMQEGL